MRRALALLLAALAAPLAAQAPQRLLVADFPTCTDGRPFLVWAIDGTGSSDCATGGGSTEVLCLCKDGAYVATSTGSGGGNSFETIDAPSGTDPVADSSADTLDIDCTAPLLCTGNSGTDALDFTIDSATVSRCARFDGSGLLVAASGDCTAGDTNTNTMVALDEDDDAANESTALVEIADRFDRYGATDEPSADKLLIDWRVIDDRWLAIAPTPATPDDEFPTGSIDGKWTVVEGAAGTVDLHENGNVEEYQLLRGLIYMQVGKTTAEGVDIRQDYTLPDGNGLIASMLYAPQGNGASNSFSCGIALNDNDTDPFAGNHTILYLDSEASGSSRVLHWDGGTQGQALLDANGAAWLAITRQGNIFETFVSLNGGSTWITIGDDDMTGTIPNNVWLFCAVGATQSSGARTPIAAFDWIRLSDDNLLAPW